MTDASGPENLHEMRIYDMPVPNRPRRWLQEAGIRTVGQLLRHTEHELLSIPNFGQVSLDHVTRFLAKHQLRLSSGEDKRLDARMVRQAMDDSRCELTPRERRILQYRYPDDRRQRLTLVETGRVMQLTRERVRQIQKNAEQKILAYQTLRQHRSAPRSQDDASRSYSGRDAEAETSTSNLR